MEGEEESGKVGNGIAAAAKKLKGFQIALQEQ